MKTIFPSTFEAIVTFILGCKMVDKKSSQPRPPLVLVAFECKHLKIHRSFQRGPKEITINGQFAILDRKYLLHFVLSFGLNRHMQTF